MDSDMRYEDSGEHSWSPGELWECVSPSPPSLGLSVLGGNRCTCVGLEGKSAAGTESWTGGSGEFQVWLCLCCPFGALLPLRQSLQNLGIVLC